MYKKFLKRPLDMVISGIILIIITPLLLTITLILYFVNSGKPFFTQSRPGFQEQEIKVIKFKTMNDRKDEEGNLLADVERMTVIGSFLRKTSLDELPQLINVLKGDMSLVGPRPLLFKYIPLYSPEQKRRHEVRPGVTGWAQVNGRNAISWKQKFIYDVYYVENLSFTLDIKILWLTILKVVKREGVNQSKERPMLPFNGSN